jgi:hypothetical protein
MIDVNVLLQLAKTLRRYRLLPLAGPTLCFLPCDRLSLKTWPGWTMALSSSYLPSHKSPLALTLLS